MTFENQNWFRAIVRERATVQDAIRNLDASGLQIVLVVDENCVLLGTITDGDVRRGLLRGLTIQHSVSEIMYETPMVVNAEINKDLVLQLMRVNKIRQLPIIDDDRKIIGLYVWDEIITPVVRENTIVIMAGGFGKRLKPFTNDCPKPMLPVAGKPILEHIIERAKGDGFRDFVISIHYLGNVVETYFGGGDKLDVNISYLKEKEPLGTAGAISLLDPSPKAPFIVTNGDVLTDVRYGEMLDFHVHHSADATMAIRQHELQNPFGIVRTEGLRVVGFEEKPIYRSHVNAGIYVLSPMVLSYLREGTSCDMPALFERLHENGRYTIAYPMHEPWLDIGRHEDYNRANLESTK